MTKEELKQEAEESFEQYKVTDEDYVVSPYSDDMGEKMLMYNYEYYAEETYLRLYKQGYLAGAEPREKRIAELEKENARLKDGIALKDEEVGCVETDFNTFKSKAKDHIKRLLGCLQQDTNDPQTNYYVVQYMTEAEQFLSEVEK